jgi:eukaryotic-like serine/threonine-protein kinase
MSNNETEENVTNRTMVIDLDSVGTLKQVRETLSEFVKTVQGDDNSGETKDLIDTQIFSETFSQNIIQLSDSELEADKNCLAVDLTYELNDTFDEGGQGIISTAQDKFLNREVAVKSLKKKFLKSSVRRSFLHEAKLTAQLDHPSIIPIYSLNSEDEEGLCFSMKKINGVTFDQYFRRVEQIYEKQGLDLRHEKVSLVTRLEHFLKVCEAVHYAHSKNVIHRDLKPDNIMIGEYREVYVMDWGIAYCSDEAGEAQDDQQNVTVCGTPGYIDPQMLNGIEPTAQTDIYSLGMILHEVSTLKVGFQGKNINKLFHQAACGDFEVISHSYPKMKIDADLKAIIEKARSPHLEDRYASVLELSNDLRHYLQNEEVSSRPDNLQRKFIRWAQNNPHFIMTAVLITILFFASTTIHSLYQQNEIIKEAKHREGKFADLQGHVAKNAHIINNQMIKIEHLMVQLAEKLMRGKSAHASGAKLYSSKDYDLEESEPEGTRYSKIFGKKVSVKTPVYKLAPGVSLSESQSKLENLFSFQADFLSVMLKSEINKTAFLHDPKSLEQSLLIKPLPIRWVYCGFEDGVFVSYPGKGGYPEEYDHRQRPWYQEAKSVRGLNWAKPYYDINGLGLVLPCVFTLMDQQNDFQGVLAFDITLDFITDHWMKQSREMKKGFRESVILNGEGEIIISSRLLKENSKDTELNNTALEKKLYRNSAVVHALQKGESKLVRVEEGGIEFVYSICAIPSLKWFYLEKFSLDELLTD